MILNIKAKRKILPRYELRGAVSIEILSLVLSLHITEITPSQKKWIESKEQGQENGTALLSVVQRAVCCSF